MTQFGNDGDDIDDDAENMTLPQTLFDHPKQNGDSFSMSVGAFSTWTEQSESIDDGYGWKKYGQKGILGAKSPIEYFRHTHKNNEGCQAIKHVQRVDKEPFDYHITYHDHNTCTQTSSSPNSSTHNQTDLSTQSGVDDDADMTLLQTLFEHPKQNADSFSRCFCSVKQNADSVAFRVPGEVEVLDDGYKWRKYDMKRMRGSKNPRSYYKCAYVGCPVRKRVQRCEEDPTMIETRYEGIHVHTCPQNIRFHHELQSIGGIVSEPLQSSSGTNSSDDSDVSSVNEPLSNRSDRISDTCTEASPVTNPVITYSKKPTVESDLESFSSMASSNETYKYGDDTLNWLF